MIKVYNKDMRRLTNTNYSRGFVNPTTFYGITHLCLSSQKDSESTKLGTK